MTEIDRFRRYEEDFLNSVKIVTRGMRILENANGNTDAVISGCVEVEGELSELEGYLKAMDVEFRSMSSAEKKFAQQRVVEYREEFKNVTQSYQQAKVQAESVALKSGAASRTKLMNSNQKIDQSTQMLEQSRVVLAQTEKVGNTILSDMESQKETLMAAHEKVTETRTFTADARKVLRTMGNRAIMHKVCVIFSIVVLAGIIGIIGYFGFGKK